MFSRAPRVASSCLQCQRRYSHKLVEVELTQNVRGLGSVGDRMPVSPGQARNLLVPRRLALYVVNGKAVSPMRDMISRERTAFARLPAKSPIDQVVVEAPRVTATVAETPIESARRAERALRDALMLVPTLFFSRRLISASSNVLLTAGPTGIFGSVTESDILEAIKEYGVTLSEGMGSIEGIETSRIKDVGKFTYTVQLKALETSIGVQIEVVPEQ